MWTHCALLCTGRDVFLISLWSDHWLLFSIATKNSHKNARNALQWEMYGVQCRAKKKVRKTIRQSNKFSARDCWFLTSSAYKKLIIIMVCILDSDPLATVQVGSRWGQFEILFYTSPSRQRSVIHCWDFSTLIKNNFARIT